MAKYKCLNSECNYEWTSAEEPFECPKCFGPDFIKVGSNKKWLKWGGIVVAALVFLAILIKLVGGSDGTTVSTDADNVRCKLSVKIEGAHKNEYRIVLRKDGVEHGKTEKKSEAVFSELEGTYTLDVIFIGSGALPKINSFPHTFTFTKPLKAPEAPAITGIVLNPLKLTKQIKDYTVTVTTDITIVPLNETEFSSDGQHWQSSNTFNNISAGTYTFYARNVRDNDLTDEKQIVLEPFVPTPPPTVAQLNDLLGQMASQNQSAYDNFVKTLGNNLPVYGASNISNAQELANEAFINSRSFQVVKIETNSDGEVVSITVH